MTSGLGTPHNSPRRGDEVVEVLSLIQEEVGSATLVLIAVVTTQSVKLLEERCRQLLPEQHVIIITVDQLPRAIETTAAQYSSTKRLTVLVSSRFSRISLQVPSQFQKLSLVPTGRRQQGLPLHVQEDSTFCDVPLHSWVNRTTHKNHEFIHREGICLVTGMARMAEQARVSASSPPLSDDIENVIKEGLDRLNREADTWETESEETDPEKASDEGTDPETSDEAGSEPSVIRTRRVHVREATAQETTLQQNTTQLIGANRSTSRGTQPFWETWKGTIATIIGALAGVSSGAAYLTMTVKGIYVNFAGFTIIAGKLNLTAACAASAGVGVGVGLVTAAAIYFIPWNRVFRFLGNIISWLGEQLAVLWARLRSRFNSTQPRHARSMPMKF